MNVDHWCPVHGQCACLWHFDDHTPKIVEPSLVCPLHMRDSPHGDAGPCSLSSIDQPPPCEERPDLPAVWDLVIADLPSPPAGKFTEYAALMSLARIFAELQGRDLVADMRERDRVGRERYGVPLQPHNGRDAALDAYAEVLDALAYTRQAIYERTGR